MTLFESSVEAYNPSLKKERNQWVSQILEEDPSSFNSRFSSYERITEELRDSYEERIYKGRN
jgi:hypothetical protein